MNKELTQFTNDVASLCCLVCRNEKLADDSLAVIHHLVRGSKRLGPRFILPLCPPHHQTGGRGVALHPHKAVWQKIHGTEKELVMQVWNEVGWEIDKETMDTWERL